MSLHGLAVNLSLFQTDFLVLFGLTVVWAHGLAFLVTFSPPETFSPYPLDPCPSSRFYPKHHLVTEAFPDTLTWSSMLLYAFRGNTQENSCRVDVNGPT